MKRPVVSVCLPNLNNRQYLHERLDSIRRQTLQDWELVVSDNYSDDGAWDLLREAAEKDSRIKLEQAPREGMYANWNRCIARAVGEFVYIATSDDNMADDCLETLVQALRENPDCDVAHCRLRMFDSNGADMDDWWSRESMFALSSGALLDRPHLRLAPYDGLLHLSGASVYISITQLLVRKSVFERVGFFNPKWGSLGDFEWNMRLGLTSNTIHVPDTWGGWRLHTSQATAAVQFESDEHARKVDDMIAHAITAVGNVVPAELRRHLETSWVSTARELREYLSALRAEPARLSRAIYTARRLLVGRMAVAEHLLAKRVFGEPVWPRLARRWAGRLGVAPVLRVA